MAAIALSATKPFSQVLSRSFPFSREEDGCNAVQPAQGLPCFLSPQLNAVDVAIGSFANGRLNRKQVSNPMKERLRTEKREEGTPIGPFANRAVPIEVAANEVVLELRWNVRGELQGSRLVWSDAVFQQFLEEGRTGKDKDGLPVLDAHGML
ncbi:MAG: hypothetical protein ACXWOX_09125, partial [Ktedonobacteraceae bacterium]